MFFSGSYKTIDSIKGDLEVFFKELHDEYSFLSPPPERIVPDDLFSNESLFLKRTPSVTALSANRPDRNRGESAANTNASETQIVESVNTEAVEAEAKADEKLKASEAKAEAQRAQDKLEAEARIASLETMMRAFMQQQGVTQKPEAASAVTNEPVAMTPMTASASERIPLGGHRDGVFSRPGSRSSSPQRRHSDQLAQKPSSDELAASATVGKST